MQKKMKSFCSMVLILTLLLSFVPVYADDHTDVESTTSIEVTTEKEEAIVEETPPEDLVGDVEKEVPSEVLSESEEDEKPSEASSEKTDENEPEESSSEEELLHNENESPLIELQPAETVQLDLSLLNDEELDGYLESLNSKELIEILKSVDKDKANKFMMKKYDLTLGQVIGEEHIMNKNGNLFMIQDFKMTPVLLSTSDFEVEEPDWKKSMLVESSSDVSPAAMSMMRSFDSSSIEKKDMPLLESIDLSVKENQDNSISKESLIISEPTALYERTDKRDAYTKNYAMSDGTTRLEIANAPVHYLDGKDYKDIHLMIEPVDYDMFEVALTENTFKTYFNDYNSLDNKVFVRYEKDNGLGEKRYLDIIIPDGNPDGQTIHENKMLYRNVYPNVDIEYFIGIERLKENIYVHEPQAAYNFKMLLDFEGLKAEILADKSIEIKDESTDEVLWYIERPYAEDSGLDQLITYDMYYELSDVAYNGKVMKQLELKFNDESFLENAVFPITIDPSFYPTTDNYGMICSSAPDNYWGYSHPTLIYGSPNGPSQVYVDYLYFNLSQVPTNSYFSLAEVQVYSTGSLGQNVSSTYTMKRLTSDFQYKTWNNRATVSNQNVATWTASPMTTKFFRVTNMMNDAWAEGYYGFEVSGNPNSNTGFYVTKEKPAKLILSYEESTPLYVDRVVTLQEGHKFINKAAGIYQILINARSGSNVTTSVYIKPHNQPEKFLESRTGTYLSPVFAIYFADIPDGPFTVRFAVTDGTQSSEKSFNYYLDNHGPTITSMNLTPAVNQINVDVSATDEGYGTSGITYKYELDGVASTFTSSTSKVFTGLTPATSHSIKVTTKDMNGLENSRTESVSTLAKVPVITSSNLTPNSMDVSFTEGNGTGALYQVMFGDKYVLQDGTLGANPVWISVTNNILSVTGLTGDTEYQIKAKAKNQNDVETNFGMTITARTSASLPDPISNVQFSMVDEKLNITWDEINNITGYEVSINDTLFHTATNSYIVENTNPSLKYSVKVRGVNASGAGEWSSLESITPANSADIHVELNETYLISVKVDNETDFSGKTYKVIYDETAFEILDLCVLTHDKEKVIGEILGLNIHITNLSTGQIEFTVSKSIPDGFNFTGPINVIKFKGLKNTNSNIKLEIE